MSKRRGGHHGGAWKVAYADFVTAMMALFMVLWLAAQDQKIKEAVERAFRNPFLSMTKGSTGIISNPDQNTSFSGKKGKQGGVNPNEVAMLRKLHEQLSMTLLKQEEEEDEQVVQFDLEEDELRISVFDRSRKPIFERNSSKLTNYGTWVITTLAWEIARYPMFEIELEGHTEALREAGNIDYDDWELSSDRANSARRTLIRFDVKPNQVRKVAGYADTQPMADYDPKDPVNRRIVILLRAETES